MVAIGVADISSSSVRPKLHSIFESSLSASFFSFSCLAAPSLEHPLSNMPTPSSAHVQTTSPVALWLHLQIWGVPLMYSFLISSILVTSNENLKENLHLFQLDFLSFLQCHQTMHHCRSHYHLPFHSSTLCHRSPLMLISLNSLPHLPVVTWRRATEYFTLFSRHLHHSFLLPLQHTSTSLLCT